MYEKRRMKHVEIILRNGGKQAGGGESNKDTP
jgi:hypothetical protein